MKQSKFPPGWNSERVKRVLTHYETQSEEEAAAEDEAAFGHGSSNRVSSHHTRTNRKAPGSMISSKKVMHIHSNDLEVLITYSSRSFYRFVYHDGALEGLDDRKKINFLNLS